MPIQNCLQCNVSFKVKPYVIRKGEGKYCSVKCKGLAFQGIHVSLVTEFKKGNHVWLGKKHSSESIKKMSDLRKQLWENVEYRTKCEKAQVGKKLTIEHIHKCLRRNPMSSLELKFQQIATENNLPYKFVGNGAFFIERKNPDFININGEKKAVEVFYKRHKEQISHLNLDEWKKTRSEIFKKYGWQLIFLDETQVNKETMLKLLKGGY